MIRNEILQTKGEIEDNNKIIQVNFFDDIQKDDIRKPSGY